MKTLTINWPVLLIGSGLLVVLAYLIFDDPLPSGEAVAKSSPASLQAPDTKPVTDKSTTAVAPTSSVAEDEHDCINPSATKANPFGVVEDGCKSGIPSKGMITLAKDRDSNELTQGVTYEAALSVLNVEPGAPTYAYEEWQKCMATPEQTPQRSKECEQLWEIMPYITLGLDMESKEGNTKSSMLLADYYASVILGAEASTWQFFLDRFDKYVAKTGQSYPQEISALRESMKPYRVQ